MNKTTIILFICSLFPLVVLSQEIGNLRKKTLSLESDTVFLDTLSIVPGSLSIYTTDKILLDDSTYRIDYFEPCLITEDVFRQTNKEIYVEYRVFNFNFKEVTRHKNKDSLQKANIETGEYFLYKPLETQSDFFGIGSLNSSGSISRGISVGNNQDAVVNSSLNLQLSGKLTDDLNIVAAITDNNIPVQPEGTTQQIQEFDKVFIQIYNSNIKLTAGDFNISNPATHFMRFNKKAQGGVLEVDYDIKKGEKPVYSSSVLAGAISKGRFAKNTLTAVEGNQGPYKLRGNSNELYIIILAGTEKVYIDGRLLQRGQEYDYIMDYNTAEITFMPKNLITKDKRIIVEFEYSDKNYARSMFYAANKLKGKKYEVQFSFFSEQDLKNQPQNQEMTDEQKFLLSQIGDSINMAVTYNIDSMSFSNEFVMYRKVDTLVNGFLYDSVFVYSIDPDSAHYRLSFSNVGQGRGNYIQQQSAANGRVFLWVAPINGLMQGTHEPVVLLIAPQKQQMFTFNTNYSINKTTQANAELAVSQHDLNTFSDFHNADNSGIALKLGVDNIKKINSDSLNTWHLKTSFSHEWLQKNFKPLERFRDAEFDRYWNSVEKYGGDEHLTGLKFNTYNKNNNISYNVNSLIKPNTYKGLQNSISMSLIKSKNFLLFNGLLTNTNTIKHEASFLRYNTTIGRNFKWFTFGIKNESEKNKFRDKDADTLTLNSFNFEQYEVFTQNADTSKNTFKVFYKYRNDFHPFGNEFKLSSKAEEAGFSTALNSGTTQRFALYVANRKLYRISPVLSNKGIKPDDNMLGRIEYNSRFLKGALNLNTFYELGSGLEVKNEFIYVEVPPGQGNYSWTDYNGNTIKELDEFEVAAFQDQAKYIKVFVPTNDYIKAYINQFNQIININPANYWKDAKGLRKFVSRFSEQMLFQMIKKTTNDGLDILNPFNFNITDSNLLTVSSTFRNMFSFNAQSPVFGIDYNFNDNRAKMLLINGFDSRTLRSNSVKARCNFNRKYFVNVTAVLSEKSFASEFFSNRDYTLNIQELEPVLSYQPNTNFRLSLSYKYTIKENKLSLTSNKALFNQIGTELRYSKLEKGNLMAKINYIAIHYNDSTNTPIAYEMLDALQPGNNITWNILYQKNLKNNMQLGLIYDGRKAGTNKTVHYGSVQIRAYF